MRSKRFYLIVIVALLAAGTAYFVALERAPSTTLSSEAQLVEGLSERVNDVDQIAATGAGGAALVTLEKGATAWTVAERDGYAADPAKIRKFLLEVADAELVERKTAKSENYAALGVEDVTEPQATGLQIGLRGLDDDVSFIVGKSTRGGKAAYVRRAGDPTTWVANRRLSFDKTPVGWLDKTLIDINSARVQQVDIKHADGKALAARRGTVNMEIDALPKGKELSSPTAANELAGVLDDLRFEDVMSRASFDAGDSQPVATTFTTSEGLVIDTFAYKVGETYYLTLASRVMPLTAPAAAAESADEADEADEAQAEPPPQDPAALHEAMQSESAAINGRVDGWVFKIPLYKYEQLTRKVADLVE